MSVEPESGASADAVINVRVERIEQLFHTLDPYPFRQRDLAAEAEEYIVGFAAELPRNRPLRIVFHMPAAAASSDRGRGLPEAISHFFSDRADASGRELRELFRFGRRAALLGLLVLAACLAVGQILVPALGRSGTGFISESLIIVGWVANWKPIEIFLYDWWPIASRRRLYRRLAAATVELRADDGL